MSGATVELDFWGMEKQNSPIYRFQKLLEPRRVVPGLHSSGISKTNSQILKAIVGSGAAIGKSAENDGFLKRETVIRKNGVLLASERPFSVPSTPKGNNKVLLSPLPLYNSTLGPPGIPTAPLTIFYKGKVSVFDVPLDKAALIMKLAEEGNLETALPVEPVDLGFATSLPLSEEQMLLQKLNGDLPIARKKSLQRFLEKRKERLSTVLPYSAFGSACRVDKKLTYG